MGLADKIAGLIGSRFAYERLSKEAQREGAAKAIANLEAQHLALTVDIEANLANADEDPAIAQAVTDMQRKLRRLEQSIRAVRSRFAPLLAKDTPSEDAS